MPPMAERDRAWNDHDKHRKRSRGKEDDHGMGSSHRDKHLKRKSDQPDSGEPSEKRSASEVAKHYNQLPEAGFRQRRQSKIFYMRNFNNWVKSVLLRTYQNRLRDEGHNGSMTVLDLGCGKGGDLLKWMKGDIKKVICTDIASTSIDQCRERYENNKKRARDGIFEAEFIVADSSSESLPELYQEKDTVFDLVSSQFVLHYSYETKMQAKKMMQNACESLRKGGYFIGTTVNSNELRKRLDQSESNVFGNDVYGVTFDSKEEFKDFGHKYNFHLDGVVDCPEYVAKREVMEKLAKKFGMRLVLWQTFSEFFGSNSRDKENKELLKRVKALEFFPGRMTGRKPWDYNHAKAVCDDIRERKPGSKPRVGTLSSTEWDAASLYVVFAFKKIESEDEQFDVPVSDIDDVPLLVLSV